MDSRKSDYAEAWVKSSSREMANNWALIKCWVSLHWGKPLLLRCTGCIRVCCHMLQQKILPELNTKYSPLWQLHQPFNRRALHGTFEKWVHKGPCNGELGGVYVRRWATPQKCLGWLGDLSLSRSSRVFGATGSDRGSRLWRGSCMRRIGKALHWVGLSLYPGPGMLHSLGVWLVGKELNENAGATWSPS